MFEIIRDSFVYNTMGAIEIHLVIIGWVAAVIWLAWDRLANKTR